MRVEALSPMRGIACVTLLLFILTACGDQREYRKDTPEFNAAMDRALARVVDSQIAPRTVDPQVTPKEVILRDETFALKAGQWYYFGGSYGVSGTNVQMDYTVTSSQPINIYAVPSQSDAQLTVVDGS